MDGRGGCCVARYGGESGGVYEYDMSKMTQILQRYRPIAPRPATAAGVGEAVSAGSFTPVVKSGKGKRKYGGGVADQTISSTGSSTTSSNNMRRCNKRRRGSSSPVMTNKTVTTLPLLPELKEIPVRTSSSSLDLDLKQIATTHYRAPSPMRLNVNHNFPVSYPTLVAPQAVKIAGSSVTVECISSDTWILDGKDNIGCTDEEKVMNLERDTCPAFISDGENMVTWTNRAYSSMVAGGATSAAAGGGEKKIAVWLVMKGEESEAVKEYERFTCRVRMQYTCKKERCSMIVPCDVWRLGCGGFAWRLDVKAALCLGR